MLSYSTIQTGNKIARACVARVDANRNMYSKMATIEDLTSYLPGRMYRWPRQICVYYVLIFRATVALHDLKSTIMSTTTVTVVAHVKRTAGAEHAGSAHSESPRSWS
jgi:hypothetical protein